MNGQAVYGEPVVIIEVRDGRVHLKQGRILSTGSSHWQADNQNRTVVWSDGHPQSASESVEELHERVFRVDDIHLLKQQEAQSLQDPGVASEWFGSIYQDGLVDEIHRSLKSLQLPQAA